MPLDFNELSPYANMSFEDFKTAYQNGNSVAAQYYSELGSQAETLNLTNVKNYAALVKR